MKNPVFLLLFCFIAIFINPIYGSTISSPEIQDCEADSFNFDSLNVHFIGNWPFGRPHHVEYDSLRNLVFLSSGAGVYILDVLDPSNPVKVSENINSRDFIYQELFYDYNTQRLYIAVGRWIEIWDVSNPDIPSKLGYFVTPGLASGYHDIYVSGSYAYCVDDSCFSIVTSSIKSSVEPEPDLLINRNGVKEFVIIECKRQMFGEESSTAKQSRGLLLQSGEQFNLAIGLERIATPLVNLVYISKHSAEINFIDGIINIKNYLVNNGFQTLPVGLLGISHKENRMYICNEYDKGLIPGGIKNILRNEIIVQEFETSENPIPLFYIPWDPNVTHSAEMAEYCERVFLEQILSAFIARVGKIYIPGIVEIFYDDLLKEATIGFYEKWRAKDTGRVLRRSVRDLINKVLNFSKSSVHKETFPPPRSGMKLTIDNEEDRESSIEAVTKFKRKEGWIKIEEIRQGSLFGEDDV